MSCKLVLRAPNGEQSLLFKDLVKFHGTDTDAAIESYYTTKSPQFISLNPSLTRDANGEYKLSDLVTEEDNKLAETKAVNPTLPVDVEFVKKFKEFIPEIEITMSKHLERLENSKHKDKSSVIAMQEFVANMKTGQYRTALSEFFGKAKSELNRSLSIINNEISKADSNYSTISFMRNYANSYDMIAEAQMILSENQHLFAEPDVLIQAAQEATATLNLIQKKYMDVTFDQVASKLASVDSTTTKEEFIELLKHAPRDVSLTETWLAYVGDSSDRVLGAIAKVVKDSQRTISRANAETADKIAGLLKAVEEENPTSANRAENLYKDLLMVDSKGVLTGHVINPTSTIAEVSAYSRNKLAEIKKTKPALFEFYEFYESEMSKANSILPKSGRIGSRLPGILKSTFERASSGTMSERVNHIQDAVAKTFLASNLDAEKGQLVDASGKPVKQVPVFFNVAYDSLDFQKAYKKELSKYTKDGREATFEEKELVRHNATQTAESLFNKRVSYDMAGSMQAFLAMTTNYSEMSEIVNIVEGAKNIIATKERKYTKTSGGIPVVDSFLGANRAPIEVSGNETNAAKQIEHLLDSQVYGMSELDLGVLAGFDVRKLVKAVTGATTMTGLAMNFLAGTSNIITGSHNTFLESFAGEYFTKKNLTKTSKMYHGDLMNIMGDIGARTPSSLINLMERHYDFLQDFQKDARGVETGRKNKTRNLFRSSSLFMINNMGEHFLQVQGSMSVLDAQETYTKDGTKTGKSVLDAHSIKDGKLSIEDVYVKNSEGELVKYDTRAQNDIADRAGAIMRKLHGNYSKQNAAMMKKSAFGAAILQFRGWMYEGVVRRWGSSQHNVMLQGQSEGFYRSTLSFMKNILTETKSLQALMSGEQWAKMTPHQKANVKRTAAEAGTIVVVALAAALLAAAGKGLEDDLERDKSTLGQARLASYRFFVYQVYRFQTELNFFVNINEALKVAKSPTASISIIQKGYDLGGQLIMGPMDVYESGSKKGKNKAMVQASKLVPVVDQFMKLAPERMSDNIQWFNFK